MANSYYPKEVEDLISVLKELPGIGQRGAERMVFSMLKWPKDKLKFLSEKITSLYDKINFCKTCGNICHDDSCNICQDHSRDNSTICVLEDYIQVAVIEKSGFKGLYHILGGKLSPLEGKEADALSLEPLLKRIDEDNISEIILALSQDVEGQATTIYIADLLKEKNVKATTLARGIPAGADLSYANSATISVAINGRTKLSPQTKDL